MSLWDDSFPHLEEAVERGLVFRRNASTRVLRVLEANLRAGCLNTKYLEEKPLTEYNVPKTFPAEPAKLALAVGSAALKNNGVLPLKKEKKLRKLRSCA